MLPAHVLYCLLYVDFASLQSSQYGHGRQSAVRESRIDFSPLIAEERSVLLLQGCDKFSNLLSVYAVQLIAQCEYLNSAQCVEHVRVVVDATTEPDEDSGKIVYRKNYGHKLYLICSDLHMSTAM